MKKYFWFGLLAIVTILSRTYWELGPNFELVTALSINAALFLQRKSSYLVLLLVVGITDLVIGNNLIFIFTWTGFLAGHFIARYFGKQHNMLKATGLSLLSIAIFYLWTNFGVVFLFNNYEHSLTGLLQSYVNALPFLRPQIFSALVFTPLLYMATSLALAHNQPILGLWKNQRSQS